MQTSLPRDFINLGKEITAGVDEKTRRKLETIEAKQVRNLRRRLPALQFLHKTIIPALKIIGISNMDVAVLLLGTAIVESGLKKRTQTNGGPGSGLFQVELPHGNEIGTHQDNWVNYLNYDSKERIDFREAILSTLSSNWRLKIYPNSTIDDYKYSPQHDFDLLLPYLERELRDNDKYAAQSAFIWYFRKHGRVTSTFPHRNNLAALAKTWKEKYNIGGKGNSEKFITDWKSIMGDYKFP